MPRTTLLRHKVEPTGTVSPFAGAVAPEGWVFANGDTLQIADYPKLFAIIGDLYGGDGVTTFQLPDYKGRALVGRDNMGPMPAAGRMTSGGAGIDGNALGASGGSQTHTLSKAQMNRHGHPYRITYDSLGDYGNGGSGGLMSGNQFGEVARPESTLSPASTTNGTRIIGGTGSGQTHQNTQPSIICNYIIKVI